MFMRLFLFQKIKPHSVNHHKHITYNFYGQVGDKIVIYVQKCRTTMPQVSNVEIHACYEDELGKLCIFGPLKMLICSYATNH